MDKNLSTTATASPFKREDAILPQAGQYWIYKPQQEDDRSKAIEGHAYLLRKVHVIDGEIHSLETAHHPGSSQGGMRMSYEDFLANYEYTDQGEEIREKEILEVTRSISDLQRQLVDHTREAANPPTQQDGGQHLLNGAEVNDPNTVTALVASGRSIAEMTQDIETRRQNMLAVSERITITTKSIETETQKLARFYQEKAGAALASVDDVLTQAEHLKKGITTLGLFAGEGVEVNLLRDGEPAKGEKLTLRQLKLHLDEELVCHIDDECGADYTAIHDLGTLFDRDPDLLDRMIPEKLGIVLLKFRRRDKEYNFSWARGINSDIADTLASIEENMNNKEQVLLVRNGEKVWEVRAVDALQNIPRLFPRERDLDDVYRERSHFFRGLESSMITPKDLQYVEARSKFDQMALEYRRVLVLLWGLDQRLQLFGHWFDRRKHQTFLTAEFQEECLNFVADEEDVLVEGRPSVHDYRANLNAGLEAGSQIVVVWRNLIDMETCPAMVEINSRTLNEELKYNLKCGRELVTVERRNGALMVPVEVTHPWRDTERKFFVNLDKARNSSSFIVIDEMRTEDIKWYLANRVARADYLDYVRSFLMAYEVVRHREITEASSIAEMVERAGGPSKRQAVFRALTHWRIASSDKMLPVNDDKALEKAKRAILVHAELLGGDRPGEVMAIVKDIEAQVNAYRIGRTINGDYVATADSPDRPSTIPFPWVQEYSFSKNGKLIRSRYLLAGHERTDVVLLKDGKSVPQPKEISQLRRRYDGKETPEAIVSVMHALNKPEETRAWQMIMKPEEMVSESAEYFKLSRKPKGRNEPVHCDLPLAILRHRGYTSVLYLTVRPIEAMAVLGDEAMEIVRNFHRTWFAHPQRAWDNMVHRGPVGFETSTLADGINIDLAIGMGGHMDRPEYAYKDAEILEKSPRYDAIISRLEELGWMKPEKGKEE